MFHRWPILPSRMTSVTTGGRWAAWGSTTYRWELCVPSPGPWQSLSLRNSISSSYNHWVFTLIDCAPRRPLSVQSSSVIAHLLSDQNVSRFFISFPSQSNSLKKNKKNQRNKITQRKRQSGERENRYRWSSSSTDERRLWAADSLRPLAQSHISLTLSHDSLFP